MPPPGLYAGRCGPATAHPLRLRRPARLASNSCGCHNILTLKVASESRVTWATFVPILVFLGLSVLELGPMYVTDRQIDVRQTDVRRQMRIIA